MNATTSLSHFQQLVNEVPETRRHCVISSLDGGTFTLAQPAKPLGFWQKCRGWLTQLRSGTKPKVTLLVRDGFIKSLREAYGKDLAQKAAYDLTGRRSLTVGDVKTALMRAKAFADTEAEVKAANAQAVSDYLGGTDFGTTPMAARFLAQQLGGARFGFQAFVSVEIESSCSAAIRKYKELLAAPGMTVERLDQILTMACQQDDAGEAHQLARELAGLPVKGSLVDERGLAVGATVGRFVKAQFKAASVLRSVMPFSDPPMRLGESLPLDAASGRTERASESRFTSKGHPVRLAKSCILDAGRSSFVIAGKLIDRNEQAVVEAFHAHFGSSEMALAVSCCTSQTALNVYVGACNTRAFGHAGAGGEEQNRVLHEAWPEADGSWTVRSSVTVVDQRVWCAENEFAAATEHPLERPRASLYELTYKIVPAQPDPVISVASSSVVFG